MTHERVLEWLDDWVAGELPPPEHAEVELHLAGCSACREEAAALQRLLAQVGALPGEILPQRELWTGIAARLQPRAAAPAGTAAAPVAVRRFPRWALQAAAVLALMAGSSAVTYLVMGPRTPALGGREALAPKPAQTAFAAFQPAEQDYQRAIGELQMALEAQRGRLAPETVRTLEANLALIDEAIRQSREALARDPNSPELARMLAGAYDQKMNVLQQVVAL